MAQSTSTARADAFAGANAKEKASTRYGRNDIFFGVGKRKTSRGGVKDWASWGAAVLRPYMILLGDHLGDVGITGRIRAEG
jgi:hypothetical protein